MSFKRTLAEGAQKALERLLSDEKRAARLAGAIGQVQRGKAALDRSQETLMRALGLAPKADFKAVSKQLASLKRRMRELNEKLDSLEPK
jgi:hypothetical protein